MSDICVSVCLEKEKRRRRKKKSQLLNEEKADSIGKLKKDKIDAKTNGEYVRHDIRIIAQVIPHHQKTLQSWQKVQVQCTTSLKESTVVMMETTSIAKPVLETTVVILEGAVIEQGNAVTVNIANNQDKDLEIMQDKTYQIQVYEMGQEG